MTNSQQSASPQFNMPMILPNKEQQVKLPYLSERLKCKRGSQSLRSLADDLGVSSATLSRIERGQIPNTRTFMIIVEWLGEDPFLFTDDVLSRRTCKLKIDHELKIYPEYFVAVKSEQKKFEVRRNDRIYKVGDVILFREYILMDIAYTGEECLARIESVHNLSMILTDDYVGMDIRLIKSKEKDNG